jgi:hypothetical protein
MKLFCVYSQQFSPLYAGFFEPSLRATSPDIELVTEAFTVGGNGDFRSHDFNRALIYKWKRSLDFLNANDDEVILITDVDIVFHRSLAASILSVLGSADIAAAPETLNASVPYLNVNVGVLALRNTPLVRQHIARLLDRIILEDEWDQKVFSISLPQSGLTLQMLPDSYANAKIPCRSDSVLYHATCTTPAGDKSSLQKKIEALTSARQFFAGCAA